jgi:predicted sugar kinase
MFQDQIKATGALKIEVRDAEGNLKQIQEVKNLVVTAGLNLIAARMSGTPTLPTHMGLGAGTVAAALADTALGSQLARVALTSTTVNGNQITYTATFNAGVATGAVTEAGVFTAASAGTMLCRTVFPVINKQAGDTITVTWVVTIA